MRKPLLIGTNNWRSRWLQIGVKYRDRYLHRISDIRWETWDDDLISQDGKRMVSGHGVSVCGQKAYFQMPGIFTRIGAKRCPKCCRLLGIPPGKGHPYNELGIADQRYKDK